MPVLAQQPPLQDTGLHVRMQGPDTPPVSVAELRRLFAGRSLSRGRRERLAATPRVVALLGDRVVGLAAFERTSDEVRVYELAFEPGPHVSACDVVRHLLDALELSCLAAGCRRLVLLPAAVVATGPLERLGFRVVREGCAGGWVEKTFH